MALAAALRRANRHRAGRRGTAISTKRNTKRSWAAAPCSSRYRGHRTRPVPCSICRGSRASPKTPERPSSSTACKRCRISRSTVDAAIDFAFFSAYKIYGPHIGFWYASPNVFERFINVADTEGPGGDARYWTLEAGTQSHEALAGWLGTMAYLRDVADSPRKAVERLADHEEALATYARAKFAARAEHLHLYGRPAEAPRLPVFAFNIAGVPSAELAERFEMAQIEARLGHYYAPRLMRAIAPAAGGVAVRLSFAALQHA